MLRFTEWIQGVHVWVESLDRGRREETMTRVINIILLAIAVEAVVELIKTAAPLQGIKEWIIKHTPFLYSERQQTHLLLCPPCTSLWVSILAVIAYLYMDTTVVVCIVVGLVAHRLSNYFHIIYSILRDKQLNIRIARGK